MSTQLPDWARGTIIRLAQSQRWATTTINLILAAARPLAYDLALVMAYTDELHAPKKPAAWKLVMYERPRFRSRTAALGGIRCGADPAASARERHVTYILAADDMHVRALTTAITTHSVRLWPRHSTTCPTRRVSPPAHEAPTARSLPLLVPPTPNTSPPPPAPPSEHYGPQQKHTPNRRQMACKRTLTSSRWSGSRCGNG